MTKAEFKIAITDQTNIQIKFNIGNLSQFRKTSIPHFDSINFGKLYEDR